MEYRLEIAPVVIARALERYHWVAETSPERAERWYLGLFAKIKTLKAHPRHCPVASESVDYGEELRFLTYGRRGDVFRVLFTIRENVIRIVGLHHAAQGPYEF